MHTTFLAAILFALLAGCTAPRQSNTTAIIGATLIDGTGATPVPDSVVIVREGKIISAGARANIPIPADSEKLDASGRFLIPGLIDLHVHLGTTGGPGFRAADYTRERVLRNLNSYLYFGVTTVRSIGTERAAGLEIRDQQRTGPLATTRLFTAGRGFTAPGGHPAQEVGDIARQPRDPDDARKQVSELAAQRVDAIKIWIDDLGGKAPKVSRPVIEAILDEAKKHNIPVTAHIHSLDDTRHFADHGGAGFLHMIRDTDKIDPGFLDQLRQKNLLFAPTLIRQELAWYFKDKPERLDDPDIARLLDPATLAAMREAVLKGSPSEAAKKQFDLAMQNTRKAFAAGIPIGVGSDGGSQNDLPGLMTHRECELLVAAGLTPMEAIVAATRNGASALRNVELGTIAAGRKADLVLLTANPVEEIGNLRKIDQVMLDGRWVRREALELK